MQSERLGNRPRADTYRRLLVWTYVLALLCAVIFVAACRSSPQSDVTDTVSAVAVPTNFAAPPAAKGVSAIADEKTAESNWVPAHPCHTTYDHSFGTFQSLLPLTTYFTTSEVAARVLLVGIEEHVAAIDVDSEKYRNRTSGFGFEPVGESVHIPLVHYEFQVLEYLRGGNGSPTIWGHAILVPGEANTEAEAKVAFAPFWERRNSRGDDREAVVFLREPRWVDGPADNYHLGVIHAPHDCEPYFVESYSLRTSGGWFPSASPRIGTDLKASGDQQFLLREPGSSTGPPATSNSGTVALSELRRLGALSDEEIETELRAKSRRDYLDHLANMNLRASVSEDAVTLSWTRDSYVARGSVRYRILRRAQDEQGFVLVADIPPRDHPGDFDSRDVQYEYADTAGLHPGTTYHYVVRAAADRLDIDEVDATVEVVTAVH